MQNLFKSSNGGFDDANILRRSSYPQVPRAAQHQLTLRPMFVRQLVTALKCLTEDEGVVRKDKKDRKKRQKKEPSGNDEDG